MVDDILQKSFEGLSKLDVTEDAGLKSNLSQWHREQTKEQFSAAVLSLKYSSVTFFLPLFLASGLWHMKYQQNGIEKF